MTQRITPVALRPKPLKMMRLALLSPLLCLFLLSLGIRFQVIGKEASRSRDDLLAANPVIADAVRSFGQNTIGAVGQIVNASRVSGKTADPHWMVTYATRNGLYSLIATEKGEVIVAGRDMLLPDTVNSDGTLPRQISEQQAKWLSRTMILALKQTPQRLTIRHSRWRDQPFWVVECQCQPQHQAVRTYQIRLEEKTGNLSYFTVRVTSNSAPGVR